jgi:hypothetical protein
MQPRVDIVGVPESATATEILQIVVENRYVTICDTYFLYSDLSKAGWVGSMYVEDNFHDIFVLIYSSKYHYNHSVSKDS